MLIKVSEDFYVNPAWVWRIVRKDVGQCEIKWGIGKWVEEVTIEKPIDEIAKILNEDISNDQIH